MLIVLKLMRSYMFWLARVSFDIAPLDAVKAYCFAIELDVEIQKLQGVKLPRDQRELERYLTVQ